MKIKFGRVPRWSLNPPLEISYANFKSLSTWREGFFFFFFPEGSVFLKSLRNSSFIQNKKGVYFQRETYCHLQNFFYRACVQAIFKFYQNAHQNCFLLISPSHKNTCKILYNALKYPVSHYDTYLILSNMKLKITRSFNSTKPPPFTFKMLLYYRPYTSCTPKQKS